MTTARDGLRRHVILKADIAGLRKFQAPGGQTTNGYSRVAAPGGGWVTVSASPLPPLVKLQAACQELQRRKRGGVRSIFNILTGGKLGENTETNT